MPVSAMHLFVFASLISTTIADTTTTIAETTTIVVETTSTAAPTTTAYHGAYHAYTASISALDNSGVSGEVTVFVTSSGVIGIGSATGLEANLSTSGNCTAGGACGTHIHSGNACTDATTQGGHYYNTSGADPWGAIKYASTDGMGYAYFEFSMTTGAIDIDGKTFVVHNNAGTRVACGIFSHAMTKSAMLMPLSGSTVQGGVTVYSSPSMIVVAGWASGLEASLADSTNGGPDCATGGACGTHVHSGTNCVNVAGQGGHLLTSGGEDGWTNVRYSSTNANGHATFVSSVLSDRTDVLGKPFIVLDNAGARVACGLLSADGHPPTTTTGVGQPGTSTTGTTEVGATTPEANSSSTTGGGGPGLGQVSNCVASAVPMVAFLALALLA